MNERTKDLWQQAACYVNPLKEGGEWQREFVEKFAELIVKECLDQCYNRGMNDALYAGQLKAAAYIEEHFGVSV